jgi:hypothetical protein
VREKYCWLVADKPSEQGVWKTMRGALGTVGSALFHRHVAFLLYTHVPAAIALSNTMTKVIARPRETKYHVDFALRLVRRG